ncbi:hypothetical protein [Sporosarcina sp. FSL W7-1283]|uniref:hypothetical protein n=1 Tax=Sporosarcina sp. FSL W7-1283 TaxID=2921560 RepID=UPI0030F5958C
MYLCKECLKVFDQYDINPSYINSDDVEVIYEEADCSSISCTGRVVKVDEMILPTIIELNKKGWITKFCCSGHLYNTYIDTYIYFKNTPPTIPDNFDFRDDAIYYKSKKFNSSSRPNNLKRLNQLFDINRELYKWAIGLPIKEN